MNKNEKALLKSYDNGKWKPLKNLKSRKELYTEYAKAALRKDKRLNIRMSSRDIEGIQKIAVNEGIPYQTLISSILHKYVANHK